MGYIHNETGNIYTHFFAAMWMVVLGPWWSGFVNEWYPATNSDDAIVFFLLFLGGTVCYLLSTAYHVFSNHSQATHLFCLKLDFLGILAVTAGCFPTRSLVSLSVRFASSEIHMDCCEYYFHNCLLSPSRSQI